MADEDDTDSDSDIDLLDVEASESSLCMTESKVNSEEVPDSKKGPVEAKPLRSPLNFSGMDSNFSELPDEKKPAAEQRSLPALQSSGTHPQTLGQSETCLAFSKFMQQSPFLPRPLSGRPDAFSSMHMQHMLTFKPGLNNQEKQSLCSESFFLPSFDLQPSPEELEYQVHFRQHIVIATFKDFDRQT